MEESNDRSIGKSDQLIREKCTNKEDFISGGRKSEMYVAKTSLEDLPVDALRLIIEFSKAGYTFTLLNKHFYHMGRHLYWKLNRTYSRKYYEDEEFRAFVHTRVEVPSIQLSLNLGRVDPFDYLNLSYITDVSALGGVHTLNLRGCSVTDVSALKGVSHYVGPNRFSK